MNSLDETLLARQCKYGNFEDVAKRSARIYHHMVHNAPQFMTKNDLSIYYEALHMIATKIARIVNGAINDADSWQDIAGYAMLVHKQIKAEQEKRLNGALVENAAMKAMEKEIAVEMSENGNG